jgi:short-subunit dehydrogenase
VRVTVVFPGAVATNITTNSGVTIPSTGGGADGKGRSVYPADKAARDILDGMEKDSFRVLVGRDAKLLDALHRLAPKRAAAFIAGQMKDLLGP